MCAPPDACRSCRLGEVVGRLTIGFLEAFARAHGLDHAVAISGWSMTSDAHHFVAPKYDTVRRCVQESIDRAGIPPQAIDAINAHAASTRIGDQVEYDALASVFGGDLPPVTANKSLIGHAMGASSAIESILAVKGMINGRLPPTINYQTPDPDCDLDYVPNEAREVHPRTALSNSFGMGGQNACLVMPAPRRVGKRSGHNLSSSNS